MSPDIMPEEKTDEEIRGRLSLYLDKFFKKDILNAFLKEQKNWAMDFRHLSRNSCVIGDIALNEPGRFIKIAQQVLEEMDVTMQAGIKNLPDDRRFSIGECFLPENADKLVEITGTINSVSTIRPTIILGKFECPECGEQFTHFFDLYDKYRRTFICPACHQNKMCIPTEDSPKHQTQLITLTEPYNFAASPPKIEIWLVDNLTDSAITEKMELIAGTQIRVVGIVRHAQLKAQDTTLIPYIQALYWDTESKMLHISKSDEREIKKLSKNKDVIQELVKSFAPTIAGHEAPKEAIILSMVRGNNIKKPDGTTRRGTIHVLLVGDPGVAKTKLAEYIVRNYPKSQYTVGGDTTAAGLSAAMRQDKNTGHWLIDPGALVMAHNSICVVDEMGRCDKNDIGPLDQVMELQTLSINKAGIQAKFNTDVVVLGVMNPTQGRYQETLPIDDQVNVPDTTLSRFDLKFLFLDKPDDTQDRKMTDHMLHPEKFKPVIPTELTMKYIVYASKLKPDLTTEAETILVNYYLNLRKRFERTRVMSITPRQFDALIRMTEAYAKLRLSKKAEKIDAENAIGIMSSYIKTFGYDIETGEIDIEKAEGRVDKGRRDQITTVIETFKRLESKSKSKLVDERELISEVVYTGLDENKIEEIIEKLAQAGTFFRPNPGKLMKT